MSQPSVHQLYQRLETVGKGGYGSVHKGRHIATGNIVALKIINLDTPDDDVADIQREVTLLTQLRDAPNITKYYGCYMDGPRVWIVMEFAQGGSVDALMKASKDSCLEEKYVSVIIREVLIGLSYLHKVPVIHRDMKAANILITAAGKVMICDFGVSALLPTSTSKRNTLTGTPYWMAPEVVQSVAVYDTKADIWSLGIMIYEMIRGSPPHSNLDRFQVMELIPRVKPPRLSEHEGSKDMRDFMTCCLKELPVERLPADELMKTKWIKSVSKISVATLKDLVMRLKQIGPRASLAEPLDWEKDEDEDDPLFDTENWEFDTVRGRPFNQRPEDGRDSPIRAAQNQPQEQYTIRLPASTPILPTSLRFLFEDNTGPQPEAYRSKIPPSSSTSSVMVPPLDKTIKASITQPPFSNDAHARGVITVPHTTSAVPAQSKKSNGVGVGDAGLVPQRDEASDTDRTTLRNIQIPIPSPASRPSTSSSMASDDVSRSSSSPSRYHQDPGNSPEFSSDHQPYDRDLASPAAFRFPRSNPKERPKPSGVDNEDIEKRPIIHSSAVEHSPFSSSHQAAHSLDNLSSRHTQSHSLIPPPISRARSATTIQVPRTPSDSKVSNSVEDPTIFPFKPSVRIHSDHTGSDASYTLNNLLGTPGLKDVLKVPSLSSEHHLGFTDLLPPSPSAPAHQTRTHTLMALSPSADYRRSPSAVRQTSDEDVLVSHSTSPYPMPLMSKADYRTEFRPPTSSTSRFTDIFSPPPIQPLDYVSLMNGGRQQLQAEMTQTIEQLAGWLGLVESGLSSIIDQPLNGVIEEEQEPSPSFESPPENDFVVSTHQEVSPV